MLLVGDRKKFVPLICRGSVPGEVKDESEGNVLAEFTRETAVKTAVLLTVVMCLVP